MKIKQPLVKEHEQLITLGDFMKSYNEHMPASYPRASVQLLNQFRDAHAALFKHGDKWSLDQHRKKLMDWLPRKVNNVA